MHQVYYVCLNVLRVGMINSCIVYKYHGVSVYLVSGNVITLSETSHSGTVYQNLLKPKTET